MKKHVAHLAYKTNSIATLSPSEITLRLLNKCLECLNESKTMIENNHVEGRNRTLKTAQQILIELMNMLNMEQEVSKVIFSLYEYLHATLIEANIHNDINKIIEVEGHIVELQNATKEAIALKRLKIFLTDQI